MSQQNPGYTVTAIRNPGGKFDHWEMSAVPGNANCLPTNCPLMVSHGNNAVITIAISDPNGPSSGPNKITFSSSPVSLPPMPKPEITVLSGANGNPLVFKDHNWNKATFKYGLNFNNAPSIDPIIQNTGGGPGHASQGYLPTTMSAFAVDLAIAFFIGVIVALIVRRVSRN